MPTTSSPVVRKARTEARESAVVATAVTTTAALEQLAPEWETLWIAARASPFQSPAWLLPWWTHLGRGDLTSVALRCERTGALVGLAPLYVYRDRASGQRHLFPLGIATTDRLDVLVAPGWEHAAGHALAEHLAASHGRWDVLEAPQLADGACLLSMPWSRAWTRDVTAADINPVLHLPARIPPSMARDLAYCRRRAARAGDVAYELADERSLPAWLDTLERLHAQRWALRGLPGVLRGEGVMAWHRDTAPRLLRAGLLRLLGLRIDGGPIAVLYVLADAPHAPQRRWSYYIGGFDPAAAILSPGTLLVGEAIDRAQAEGAVVFDFLRGAEPYKLRWGAVPQPMWTLRLRPA
ncbi:GNAT family N-acetyltransferase [Ramlibacter sp. MMS24-I3-19]|uniref:GNAT family N-acetyltransferase n=1 Tax=Ramlibacter sp. MMS24-I3-19 TaxID=3416606 RepID=UPI003D04B499